jgi:hypothetical protein
MPITKGQQLWRLRKHHGPDRKFATSAELWKAACKYFEWCDNNPLIELQQMKSMGQPYKDKETGETIFPSPTIEMPKMRAYTMQALCIHLGVSASYFRKLKTTLTAEDAIVKEFSAVISKIENVVYTQKFEGAAAGFFNANIIARELGLTDKKELDHKGILIGKDLEDFINGKKTPEDEIYE